MLYAKNFLIQVLTVGALHQIDSAALRSAASAWHDEFAPLPKPLLVVNIGGPTSNFLSFFLILIVQVDSCGNNHVINKVVASFFPLFL